MASWQDSILGGFQEELAVAPPRCSESGSKNMPGRLIWACSKKWPEAHHDPLCSVLLKQKWLFGLQRSTPALLIVLKRP